MFREIYKRQYQVAVLAAVSDTQPFKAPPVRPTWRYFGPGVLQWNTVPGVTYYEVEKRSQGVVYEVIATSQNPELTGGLVAGPAFFRVRAVNEAGKGPASHPVWIE